MVITVLDNVAIIQTDIFLYANKWSSGLTWGDDSIPIDGDTVFVPKGKTLVVDQSTPKLSLILVEGSIIFADAGAYVVSATSIIIDEGLFRAGTQASPYTNKLTFILDGDSTGIQSLGFGNKVIGCYACTFDMNGKARDQTWGELSASVAVDATQIVLATAADW